ncbi:hypothetical protein ACLB2K_007065 [Fragaria x ananassa]
MEGLSPSEGVSYMGGSMTCEKLDHIARDDRDGARQYGIDTLVSAFFLQVLVWERWFGKKAKNGAFKLAVIDKIEQFNFRPYFIDHGFLKFPFFHPGRGSSPFIGPTELLLTTTAQSIVACDDLFGPSREKYSPDRVKRQFGIDQDVPSHLSFGGNIGECIASFTWQLLLPAGTSFLVVLGKKTMLAPLHVDGKLIERNSETLFGWVDRVEEASIGIQLGFQLQNKIHTRSEREESFDVETQEHNSPAELKVELCGFRLVEKKNASNLQDRSGSETLDPLLDRAGMRLKPRVPRR